jgi:hypothetical protein
MQIFIKIHSSYTLVLEVEATDLIEDVKALIYLKERIGPEN